MNAGRAVALARRAGSASPALDRRLRALRLALERRGVLAAPRVPDPVVGWPGGRVGWLRSHGRPVLVAIAAGPDDAAVVGAVRSVVRQGAGVRVVVADGGLSASRRSSLTAMAGVEVVPGGLAEAMVARRAGEDVAVLGANATARPGWVAWLQWVAWVGMGDGVGVVAGRVLGDDGALSSCGVAWSPDAPRSLHGRLAGWWADYAPAGAMQTVLAPSADAAYVRGDCLDALGPLDPALGPLAVVDLGLRAWAAGWRVTYAPEAVAVLRGPAAPLPAEAANAAYSPAAPATRPTDTAAAFWSRWAPWFSDRKVTRPDGSLHVIYVTQDTGIGGGHRVVFEHLDGLKARGHETELWTLAADGPDWFDLATPVRRFSDYPSLMRALRPLDGLKVATWWETAEWVWEGGIARGIPAFYVQDIESSYYPHHPDERARVHASYRPEFAYLTTSGWVRDGLTALQPTEPEIAAPGLDVDRFRPTGVARAADRVLALGRSNPLKDFPLTRAAYLELGSPRPELVLFGTEPELAEGLGERARYVVRPSDEEVNSLLNTSTVLLQTSKHEGYCLPILEAMAAGLPVVCTDAHGNRDFCVDGINCLMPESTPAAVAEALARLLLDEALRERLVAAGAETAAEHDWSRRLDALDETLQTALVRWGSERQGPGGAASGS